MTYDLTPKVVVVSVASDASGRLSVVPTYPDDTTFHNTYEASGSWTPRVKKELIGSVLDAAAFRFELRQGDVSLETVTNAADGQIAFTPLTYTQADIGKTYTYTICEIEPAIPLPGIIYDPLVMTIPVTIGDAGNGVLHVVPTYPEATTFRNVHRASGVWLPTGTKHLQAGGRELQEDAFSFKLTRLNDAGDECEWVGTYGHAMDGTIRFEPIHFTEQDSGKTFFFRIEEVAGDEQNMMYAPYPWDVQVEVKQGIVPGALSVTPTYTTYR